MVIDQRERTSSALVGSARAEKAGGASGISETAAELGGALGIAVLGSLGVAINRSGLAAGLPGIPAEAAGAARDTLGGAISVAGQLPEPAGAAMLDVARESFVAGLQLTSAAAATIAAVVAVVAAVALRENGAPERAPESRSVTGRVTG